MKKTIRTIICMAAFAVLAVSCQKETGEVEPVANTKETIEFSINGLMGEYNQIDATKSELVNTVRVSWKDGDIVYVYDGTQCLGSLVASLDENGDDRYALLSTDGTHTVTAPAAGTKLTLVHSPLLTEAPAVIEGAISISLANQNGEKAPFVAYATLDYNNEESINKAFVPFKFATSVIKVNCTGLKANTAIVQATLDNVNTACKITLSGTADPTVTGAVNGTITRTNDTYFAASKVNGEGVAVFQIAAPELKTTSDARVLTVSQGSDSFEYRYFSTKALSVATSVNTVCQTIAIPAGAMSGVFTVSNDGGITKTLVRFSQGNLTYNVSTKKWAFYEHQYDCATSYDANLISLFTWGYNAEKSIDPSGRESDNVNRTSGNLSQDEDWGSRIGDGDTWRTLTNDEWTYLLTNHSCKSASVNGVDGYVIAPDGFSGELAESYDDAALATDKLVFLPIAGLRQGSSVVLVGNSGAYWSSSAKDSERAYCIMILSGFSAAPTDDYRYLGYSVRLVTDVAE